MKCKNCGSEWHASGNVKTCPFCDYLCTLPEDELLKMYEDALAISDESREEKAAAFCAVAEYGYAPAQYSLGLAYEEGKGLPKSESMASVYYRYAAEQGHAPSAFRLALCLRHRHFGTAELDISYFWLRIAAELGVPEACRLLGDCYAKGEGIAENPLRAAYWYTRATEDGDFPAAYRLAALYRDGRGVKQNPAYQKYYAEIAYNGGIRAAERMIQQLVRQRVFSEVPKRIEIKNRNEDRFELGYRAYGEGKYTLAVMMYRLAAEDGYARARNNLGICYEKGHGVPKEEDTAVIWYRLAAEGGYNTAWMNLGDCYLYGRGVEQSEEEAFVCYLTAAKNGFAHAQYVVGNCYYNATLVDRNIQEAMAWYEKAALQGDKESLNKIDEIRTDMTDLYNRGVEAYELERYADAVKFYTIASEFGHRGAQCNLGYCYQNGLGCEKNERYAVYYYAKAAAQDSGVAELNLALCYLRGEGGLTYDYRKANELLVRAASHGAEQAKELYNQNITQKKKKMARRIYAMSAAILARGVQELPLALQFRRIAAEMGNARAMFSMGSHYEFGFGVTMDEAVANDWYRRAHRAGYRAGSRIKSAMLKMMKRHTGFRRAETEAEEAPTADASEE